MVACIGVKECNCFIEEKSPTNGDWSNWGDWTECSAKCNGGVRYRERICNNHLPHGVGNKCEGEGLEKELCNKEACEPGEIVFFLLILLDILYQDCFQNFT